MTSSIDPQNAGGDDDGTRPDIQVSAPVIGRVLGRLSELFALLGGAIMIALMLMTVISIAGRYFFNVPIKGDFELTEIGCGIAVFLFFPYTQISGHNIIAEFFTMGLSERNRARLDGFHSLVFALVAAFLTWRLFEGVIEKIESAERTMLLGLPLWSGYVFAVAGCALLTPVCLWCAVRIGFGRRA